MKKIAILFFVFISFSFGQDFKFTSIADMNNKRYGAGYTTDGNFVYVTSGADNSTDWPNNVERYDPNTDTWEIFAEDLMQRTYTNAEYVNGNIYLFNGSPDTNLIEIINVSNGNLSKSGSNPYPVHYGGSAVWNDKIYVFGGENIDGYSNRLYEYNPADDSWKRLADMPESKQTNGQVVNGILYTFGGYNGSNSSHINAYNIELNTWEKVGDMSVGVSSHSVVTDGENIVVIGDYSNIEFCGIYYPTQNKFLILNNNMEGRRHSASVYLDGFFYTYGGSQPEGFNGNTAYTVLSSAERGEIVDYPDNGEYSLSFDGVDDYVIIEDATAFDFGTGAFSVSAWFKKVGDERGDIINLKGLGGDFGLLLGSDETLQIYFNDFVVTNSANSFTLNEWHHAVFVRDSYGGLITYIDGAADGSGNQSADITANKGDLRIGSNHDNGNSNLQHEGEIDEVAFWNTELTATEVLALYNNGTPLNAISDSGDYSSSSNLTGYWNFNEGSGTTLIDQTGNINHGNIVGATWSMDVSVTNYSLSLDGVDDYVQTESKWFEGINNYYTISSRFRINNNEAGNQAIWFHRAHYRDHGLQYNQEENKFIYGSGAEFTGVEIGRWYDVSIVRNGQLIEMYVDGNLASFTTVTGDRDWSTEFIGAYFGADNGFYNVYLEGNIEQISMFDVALSEEEIVYNLSTELIGNESNLVGLWKFDNDGESVLDLSSNENHGTIQGAQWSEESPTPGCMDVFAENYNPDANMFDGSCTGYQSNGNYSLYFDGDSDVVTVLDDHFLDLNSGDFTVEAWIKNEEGISEDVAIAKLSNTGRSGYSLVTLGNDEIEVTYRTSSVIHRAFGEYDLNNWHHVVSVLDRDTGISIYVNGELVSQVDNQNFVDLYLNNSGNLLIGAYNGGYNWKGWIDEVKVWSHAKSLEQVQESYNGEITYPQKDLVTHLTFNEGEKEKVWDHSGNGNHGNVVGAEWSTDVPSVIPPLLGHWDFNHTSGDTVFDKSGNNYHGVISGDASFVSDTSDGIISQSLNFDGINDFVQTELYLNTLPYTIEVRFKAFKNSGEQSLVDTDVGGQNGNSIILGYTDGDNTIDVQYNDGWYNSPRQYVMNNWYTALATYHKDSVRLYVNGAFVGSKTFTQGNLNGSKARFGRHNSGDPQWFMGLIDEVKIWNSIETQGLSQIVDLPPIEPKGLVASNVRPGEVRLDWTPSTEKDIDTYYIYANASSSENDMSKRVSNISWSERYDYQKIFESEAIKDDSVTIQADSLNLYKVEVGYVDVHSNGKGTIKFTYLDDTEDIFEFNGNGSISFLRQPSRLNRYEVVKTSGGNDPYVDRNNLKIFTLARGLKSILIGDDNYQEWAGLTKVNISSLPQLRSYTFTNLANSSEYLFTVAASDTAGQLGPQSGVSIKTLSVLSISELPKSNRIIAFYPLDGNAHDVSGNNNHGKIEGGVLPAVGRNSKNNSAFYFDGKPGSKITSKNNLALADSSHTISIWAKPEGQTYVGNHHLFAHGTSQNNNGLHTRFQGTSIRYGFWSNDLDVTISQDTSSWQNFIFTFDHTSKARKVFRNGELLGSDLSASLYKGVGPFAIGAHVPDYSNSESWLGLIDDVIIWDIALNDSLIMLYSNQADPILTELPDIAIPEDSSASFSFSTMYIDTVSYSITSNIDVISVAIDSSLVTLTPKKDWFGTVDLTLTADDFVFFKGEVLAFNPAHISGGYAGNFFGILDSVYLKNKHLFKKGSSISIYSQSMNKFGDFLVDYVTDEMSYEGAKTQIRYLYIQTPQYSDPPCNTCPESITQLLGSATFPGDTWYLNRSYRGVKAQSRFALNVSPVQDIPSPFNWVSSSVDTISLNQNNLNESYKLEWSESIDVDQEIVNYKIYAKIGAYTSEVIYDSTDTSYTLLYQEMLDEAFNNTTGNAATISFRVYSNDGIDSVIATNEDRVLYINRYDYLSIENKTVPKEFALHENFPNPFNPSTQIRFDIPETSDAVLTIYNMLGQKVKVFKLSGAPAGYHTLTWNATNEYGNNVGAGVYLYQLHTKEFIKTRKMVLLK